MTLPFAGLAGLYTYESRRSAAVLGREIRNAADAASISAWMSDLPLLFGEWAVDADFGALLLFELRGMPDTVVEIGSGLSTLLTAAALESNGRGRLYSIEADQVHADRTRKMLEAAGVDDRVELIVSPLEDRSIGGREVRWHDPGVVSVLQDRKVDLITVDGPPTSSRWSRWPAVEVLYPYLAVGGVVLLDDGRRAHESRCAFQWARDHQELEVGWVDTTRGTWRLTRRVSPRRRGASEALRHIARTLNPRPAGSGKWPVRRW
jgi:predicted O-methyltransferase YrrM